MTTEVVSTTESTAPAVLAFNPIELVAIQADVLLARRQSVERVVKEVMVPGVHFGEIPGVKGKSLLKPGTEILAASFQLGIDYEIETIPDDDGRRYVVKALITHQPTGAYLGSGMGECSTNETKWKWRGAHDKEVADTQADRRRKKYTKDGREYWQVRQEVADVGNTVLKQACKRAAADAVLAVLGVRGVVLDSDPVAQASRPQAPRGRPPLARAGAAKVKEMVAAAAAKGINEDEILARLKVDRGFKGSAIADVSPDDCAWVAKGISDLPDVDPVSGELVVEGAAGDAQGEMP